MTAQPLFPPHDILHAAVLRRLGIAARQMHIMTAELAGGAQALAARGQSRAIAGSQHAVAAELAEAHAAGSYGKSPHISAASLSHAIASLEAGKSQGLSPDDAFDWHQNQQLDGLLGISLLERVQHHRPDDTEQLRDAISKLAHELAEALTAANGYLEASQRLESRSDPASPGRLHEAISKAIEQTKRAGEIVAKLRSIASP